MSDHYEKIPLCVWLFGIHVQVTIVWASQKKLDYFIWFPVQKFTYFYDMYMAVSVLGIKNTLRMIPDIHVQVVHRLGVTKAAPERNGSRSIRIMMNRTSSVRIHE